MTTFPDLMLQKEASTAPVTCETRRRATSMKKTTYNLPILEGKVPESRSHAKRGSACRIRTLSSH